MRRECFGGSGQGHLEVDRGGQHRDAFDTVVVEIGQGAVDGSVPVVSFRLRGFEMPAEERMLTRGNFARDNLRRIHPESFAYPWQRERFWMDPRDNLRRIHPESF